MDIQLPTKFKISLLGDSCLDLYWFGTVDRISPEAPVPVFCPQREEQRAGMAGNVRLNLERLGAEVRFYSGSPGEKTRLIDQRSKQHIARIDRDLVSEPLMYDPAMIQDVDAVVISDYGRGAITLELIEQLRSDYSGPMFLDTKKTDLACFHGIFVKINEIEYSRRVSINHSLIVTMGARGAMYSTGRDPKHHRFYPAPEVEVTDVCGAGDTFLAAVAWCYLWSGRIESAIEFAIRAASVTVQHVGCYAPSLEEIQCV
jgi:bifunctional ADP-heptose synthase (sugar kinase/adenylyltransferase)